MADPDRLQRRQQHHQSLYQEQPLPPPSQPQAPPLPQAEPPRPGAVYSGGGLERNGAVPQGLVRRRSRTEDKFFIPERIIPQGWSYEWKRESCYGQPDTDHQTNLRENYWAPVPSRRHPEMMPTGFDGPIRKDGMVLMERPKYLTDDAHEEDFKYAMGEVGRATAQLGQAPEGHFTRQHPSVERISGVRRTYGPMDPE